MMLSNPRRDHHAFVLFVFVLAAMLLAQLPWLSRAAIAAKQKTPHFEQVDVNRDGQIDAAEAAAWPVVAEGLARADRNGNGKIDKVEFGKAF
jgi:hypothetical protein